MNKKNMKFMKFFKDENNSNESIVVIFAKFNGKWLLCKHKNRGTYEVCGGHIEPGESEMDAAKRELYEESGAIASDIHKLGYYSFTLNNKTIYGGVFFANIRVIQPLPPFEMKEVKLFDEFPQDTTYPQVYKELIKIIW